LSAGRKTWRHSRPKVLWGCLSRRECFVLPVLRLLIKGGTRSIDTHAQGRSRAQPEAAKSHWKSSQFLEAGESGSTVCTTKWPSAICVDSTTHKGRHQIRLTESSTHSASALREGFGPRKHRRCCNTGSKFSRRGSPRRHFCPRKCCWFRCGSFL